MGEPFSALREHWTALQPHRIGFTTNLLFDESLEAARAATDGFTVEVLSHQFLAGDLSANEETWRAPRERLSKVIEHAKRLGAKTIYMVTGGHGGLVWEEAAEIFAAAVAPCVAQAKAAGIPLLVESSPPLYAHSHIAHNLRDTVKLAEIAGIGVCIDIFAVWTEADLRETIERAAPRLNLIQVGDYVLGDRAFPCRAVPGDGVIPLKRICGWAIEAGYKGAFDLELLGPRLEQEGRRKAVGRAAEYMSGLLDELGA
jgi:sugar phosphate isomerase/epimerase